MGPAMSATLTPIDGGRRQLAATTAQHLRELADLVEAGRAEDVVSISTVDGHYQLETSASPFNTLALVAILSDWAMGKARR